MDKALILNMLGMLNCKTVCVIVTSNNIDYEVSWYIAENNQRVLNIYADGREIIPAVTAMAIALAIPVAKTFVEDLKE